MSALHRVQPTIVTTEEEIEGFYVVKSIVREVLVVGRAFMRGTQTYRGVLVLVDAQRS